MPGNTNFLEQIEKLEARNRRVEADKDGLTASLPKQHWLTRRLGRQ